MTFLGRAGCLYVSVMADLASAPLVKVWSDYIDRSEELGAGTGGVAERRFGARLVRGEDLRSAPRSTRPRGYTSRS